MNIDPISNCAMTLVIDDRVDRFFKIAELGRWREVFNAVKQDPSLLALKKEGKTVLWMAAHAIASKPFNLLALTFIEEALKEGWSLDFDAFPDSEPGKSVFWLLCLAAGHFHYDTVSRIHCLHFSGMRPVNLIKRILELYPQCNINAAPQIEPYKDISACALIISKHAGGLFFIPIFLNSPFISYSSIDIAGSSNSTLLWLCVFIRNNLDASNLILKMLENNPDCDVNMPYKGVFPGNALELILDLPPFPAQRKILLYLLLCGAELRNYTIAADVDKPKIEMFREMKDELNFVFNSAFVFYLNQIKIDPYNELINELKLNIALKMIWSSFPELENVPFKILKKWFIKMGPKLSLPDKQGKKRKVEEILTT